LSSDILLYIVDIGGSTTDYSVFVIKQEDQNFNINLLVTSGNKDIGGIQLTYALRKKLEQLAESTFGSKFELSLVQMTCYMI